MGKLFFKKYINISLRQILLRQMKNSDKFIPSRLVCFNLLFFLYLPY